MIWFFCHHLLRRETRGEIKQQMSDGLLRASVECERVGLNSMRARVGLFTADEMFSEVRGSVNVCQFGCCFSSVASAGFSLCNVKAAALLYFWRPWDCSRSRPSSCSFLLLFLQESLCVSRRIADDDRKQLLWIIC